MCNKTKEKKKRKETHRYIEQTDVYQRVTGLGGGQKG